MLDKVLFHMKPHGRVACGMRYPRIDNFYEQGLKNLSNGVTKKIGNKRICRKRLQGFISRISGVSHQVLA
ncbi:hypothetical protein SLEP1_g41381 [Rubroshorea leprosula]|uniref:Uncharacterized protein n=1 Tax=Rubroshorea leprosula TaxID=152421 RepID=A0AAV5L6D1_9ROSI|nr:hypothetical protein SLEP1_g41381 [Rubroshorea leprosula]